MLRARLMAQVRRIFLPHVSQFPRTLVKGVPKKLFRGGRITKNANLNCRKFFNTDENNRNYKMLPSKTLAGKGNREAPGANKCKECVTFLM